jgi:hypothetical protein
MARVKKNPRKVAQEQQGKHNLTISYYVLIKIGTQASYFRPLRVEKQVRVAKYNKAKTAFENANPGQQYHKTAPKGPSGKARPSKAGSKYSLFFYYYIIN